MIVQRKEKTNQGLRRSRTIAATVCALAVSLLVPTWPVAAQSDIPERWRLALKDGGYATGQLVASEQAGRVGWWIPGFDRPFELDIDAIRTITAMESPGLEAGTEHSIELADGSVVRGRLMALDDQTITLESPILGRVRLRRDAARRLRDATYVGRLVYAGPLDPQTWTSRSRDEDWDFQAGALVATRQGAIVVGRVGLPAQAQIDFALSWRGVPNFVFSFGTSAESLAAPNGPIPAAVRLEVWDKQLALVREVGRRADLKMLSDLAGGSSRIELTMFLDQQAGTAAVYDSHGRLLDAVAVRADTPTVLPAVHLANNGPGLKLEHFEVHEWDGTTQPVGVDEATTILVDGTRIDADIAGFDAEHRRVELRPTDGAQPIRLGIDQIRIAPIARSKASSDRAEGPKGPQDSSAPGVDGETTGRPGDVEVVLVDRSRLIGQWLPSRQGLLRLDSLMVENEAHIVSFQPQHVRGLIGHRSRYQNALAFHKNGMLKIDDWELSGYMQENSPDGSTTALFWRPHCSRNAAGIGPELSGAIQYRKPLPAVRIESPQPRQPGRVELPPRIQILLDRHRRAPAGATEPPSGTQQESVAAGRVPELLEIVFRSGDAIDGHVERIDARGVHFRSPQTETNFAPHAQVQSVQLHPGMEPTSIDREKLHRLTTVPRVDRDDPPTHLLISIGGDFLRCRLLGYDGHRLSVDIRGHQHAIAGERIATVVWLHDRNWSRTKADSAAGESAQVGTASSPFLVHVINQQGRGLTFRPTRTIDNVLEGHSDLLGECRVRLEDVDQLLFGRDVADRVRRFHQNPWVLSLARLPRDFDPDRLDAPPQAAAQ
ncbi:MAG: hypothetical protein D6753_09135 [Planctomycetota bacterium]|nr:MAG: hypothetical protein D6753_09135 [Planctomycetota bacterium]